MGSSSLETACLAAHCQLSLDTFSSTFDLILCTGTACCLLLPRVFFSSAVQCLRSIITIVVICEGEGNSDVGEVSSLVQVSCGE